MVGEAAHVSWCNRPVVDIYYMKKSWPKKSDFKRVKHKTHEQMAWKVLDSRVERQGRVVVGDQSGGRNKLQSGSAACKSSM